MSKIILNPELGLLDVHYDNGKNGTGDKLFTASILDCERHGGNLSITDPSGSDWCVLCLEEMIEKESVEL